jgi:hypothetical protein
MSSETSLHTAAAVPTIDSAPARPSGLLYHWGPQAWIDMWMSRSMIVKKAWPLVSYTILPILRLTTDAERVDREYAEIRERREPIKLFDSPRERWRKHYGNFVRELEWALLELRKHYTREQYEEIVVGTSVALAYENSQDFVDMMKSMADSKPPKNYKPGDGPSKPSRLQKLSMDMFNPAGFLTGPAEITSYDPGAGEVMMEIPDCAWHICGDQKDLPNPDALPEEGCLLICKGAFERLFDGEDGGLRVEFEPHLPLTSCTVRMSWRTQQPS